MKTFKNILACLFLACISIVNSYAQNYIEIGNYIGIDNASALSTLNSKSSELIESLPGSVRDSFKVYSYFSYILREAEEGDSYKEIDIDQVKSNINDKYYLLFAKFSTSEGVIEEIVVDFNFPKLDSFSCFTEFQREEFKFRLNNIANSQLNHVGNPNLYYIAEEAVLDSAIIEINRVVSCCDPGLVSSCETCRSDQSIIEFLRGDAHLELDITVTGEIVSFTNLQYQYVTDYANLEIDLDGFSNNLAADLDALFMSNFTPGGGNISAKGVILDKDDICNGAYNEQKTILSGYEYTIIAVIVEVEGGNDKLFINIGLGPCFKAYALSYMMPLEGAFKEVKLMHNQETAMLKIKYGCFNNCSAYEKFKIWTAAAWNVCGNDVHLLLDGFGIICDICDYFNGGIYLLEGNNEEAQWRFIAAVPVVGAAVPIQRALKAAKAQVNKTIVTTVKGVSGHTIKLYIKVKNGKTVFGYSGQLSKVIGTLDGHAAHHLIPMELFEKLGRQTQLLINNGFHPNIFENGKHVPITINGRSFHNGNHPKYTGWVDKMLSKKLKKYPDDPVEAARELNNEIIKHLDDAVAHIENKKEYLTLDNYWAKYIIDKIP